MKSARAARPQTRGPQALADVRHDGVGHFPGCPTQGRCKVCQNNTRIMRLKWNVRSHRSTLPCAKKCTMSLLEFDCPDCFVGEINNFKLVSTVCAENRQCSYLGT